MKDSGSLANCKDRRGGTQSMSWRRERERERADALKKDGRERQWQPGRKRDRATRERGKRWGKLAGGRESARRNVEKNVEKMENKRGTRAKALRNEKREESRRRGVVEGRGRGGGMANNSGWIILFIAPGRRNPPETWASVHGVLQDYGTRINVYTNSP